jgi:uncharacterized MnhB-related membrane protein
VIPLQATILTLVGLVGAAVALTRDPLRQVVVFGLYGLLLSVLFVVFQAPDVGLSELVVGTVGFPLILLAALAKVRRGDR